MFRFLVSALLMAFVIYWGDPSSVRAQEAQPLTVAPAAKRASLPALPFKRLDGNPASLDDYKGKVVVLNLWATWCAPCKKEMPSLARLQAAFPKDRLIVLAVSVDQTADQKVVDYLKQAGIEDLEVLRDPAMKTPRILQLAGIPATLVVDKDGKEAARVLGEADWSSAPIQTALQALVAEGTNG